MRKLLFSITKKNLEITYFSGKGAGGQHRNKCKNCVRINHPDSGVIVTGQEERSLRQNLKNALSRLIKNEKFKNWIKIQASKTAHSMYEIQKKVDESMMLENLKVEHFKNGKWRQEQNES
jgi:protein subunit release factor A